MDRKHFSESSNIPSEIQIVSHAPAPDDEFYMRHKNRGRAIIINHKTFAPSTRQGTRYGTGKDGRDLELLLRELNFEIHSYEDLRCHEIMDKLKDIADMDHSDCDCILIAVMTHGDNGILYAYDGHYPTQQLWTHFSPLHCSTLAGKPKLFFIQACRGEKCDPGVTLAHDEVDSVEEKQKIYTIPIMADFLFMYATFEGYYAWRDLNKGSPFIQALINQFRIHHKSKDLLTILTHVNREVAIGFRSKSDSPEFDGKKEMCSIISMLTRLFYLD